MAYFLVSTEHLQDKLWFRDNEDFKAGMNFVALCSTMTGVRILAFILMSNHIHLVVEGSPEQVRHLINQLKRQFSRYLSYRYGLKETLRRNNVDIRILPEEDESLERAIAYVIMNCVAANICYHPAVYPWGSGAWYFNAMAVKGTPMGLLSRRARQRLIHSKHSLPCDFIVGEDGYILPCSYIPTGFVEALFKTPKRFNYFLANSSKARMRLAEEAMPSFRDQSILAASQDLCQSLFRCNGLQELDGEQTKQLIQELRRRFSADAAQLARVTGLTYSETVNMLDSI